MITLDANISAHMKWPTKVLAIMLTTGSLTTPPPYSTTETPPLLPGIISHIATSDGESFSISRPLEAERPNPSSASWTVSALRAFSGLTATQLGRLFGVSRRSVNNWIAGNPMAAHHEDRLLSLQDILVAVPATTPEERRSALLDSSKGLSIFQQLVNEAPEEQVLQSNPLAASDQF